LPVEKWEVEGLDLVNATLQEHMELLREIPTAAKEIGSSMRDLTNVERQYRRGIVAVRTAWRNQHAAWIETMRIARRVQSVFRTFRQLFESYTLGQIRIERQARDVADAQKDVAYYTDLYNQYLRDFGEESALTEDAYDKMKDAIQRAKDEQDALSTAQNDMLAFWISAAVEMPIQVAFAVTGIVTNLNTLRGVMTLTKAEAAVMWGAITLGAALLIPTALDIHEMGEEVKRSNEALREGKTDWEAYLQEVEKISPAQVESLIHAMKQAYEEQKSVQEIVEHFYPLWEQDLRRLTRALIEAGYGTDEIRKAMEELGYVAVTGSVLPDIVEWTQKAKSELSGLVGEMSQIPTITASGRRPPQIRSVTMYNRFGDIHNVADLDNATLRMYRRLIRMLETA